MRRGGGKGAVSFVSLHYEYPCGCQIAGGCIKVVSATDGAKPRGSLMIGRLDGSRCKAVKKNIAVGRGEAKGRFDLGNLAQLTRSHHWCRRLLSATIWMNGVKSEKRSVIGENSARISDLERIV